MAFFSLTDISFNTNRGIRKGLSGPLEKLDSSKYESNTFRYPSDLGNYDKGHYMVIHINEQRETQFKGEAVAGDLPTVLQNRKSLSTTRGSTNIGGNISTITGVASDLLNKIEQNGLSKTVDNFIAGGVKAGISNVFGGSNSGSNAFSQFLSGALNGASQSVKSAFTGISNSSFTRTIQRTTDTIALYMPDTLTFTYNQSYDTPKTGGDVMSKAGALAAGAAAIDAYKSSDNPNAQGAQGVKNLAPFAAAALAKSSGDLGKVLFAAGTGLAMNPMMEMIYSAPQFRNFRFDFMFYPRDESEATEVQLILERLRFHQAPEIKSGSGGFFLIPPSEFDIKFYYNGYVNPNIPPITTCVLKMIDIDYAAVGQWAAYETPSQLRPQLGSTGMPVGIRLTLEFEETEIQTKDSYSRSNRSSLIGM